MTDLFFGFSRLLALLISLTARSKEKVKSMMATKTTRKRRQRTHTMMNEDEENRQGPGGKRLTM